jgi:cardiolipin synthase A/B
MEQIDTTLLGTAIALLGALFSATAVAHALLNKRRPESAFGWIGVSLIFPFVGPLLYFLFGVNRVRTRARKLRGREQPQLPMQEPMVAAPAEFAPLAQLGWRAAGSQLVAGNSVDELHNGEQVYPAMLAAIAAAERRISMSTYIFDGNRSGREFAAALRAAAARGVEVRVLLDGFGELYSLPPARWLFRRSPVRVARFLPPRLLPPSLHVNMRNHRKILVVDGHTAFTGGINIGDRYLADNFANASRVVDLHFRLRGPIATHIEAVFMQDWQFVTGEALRPDQHLPAAAGTALCRAIADGPDDNLDRLTTLLVGALGIAKHRIAIMTPYFLPPRELIGALQAAALRDVDVAVILPAKNNLFYVHRATRHMLWELLQRGVRVYYQPPPFVHSKLLLIDESYAQIGSANIDPRSLRLNFELTIEIYGTDVVARLGQHFEAVRGASTEVALADVEQRRLSTKVVDGVAWLFSPYL